MRLDALEIGKDAVVASVESDDSSLRQHIFDMGLTPGTEVTMVKYAPMGDPLEIRLRGYELTLRKDDAARISLVDCMIPMTFRVRRHRRDSPFIPLLARAAIRVRCAKRSRRELPSRSPLLAIRTVARPRCSTG